MQPPGSGPGITHFARTPATAPITIQLIMAVILISAHLPPIKTLAGQYLRYHRQIYNRFHTSRYTKKQLTLDFVRINPTIIHDGANFRRVDLAEPAR